MWQGGVKPVLQESPPSPPAHRETRAKLPTTWPIGVPYAIVSTSLLNFRCKTGQFAHVLWHPSDPLASPYLCPFPDEATTDQRNVWPVAPPPRKADPSGIYRAGQDLRVDTRSTLHYTRSTLAGRRFPLAIAV